MIAGSNPLVGTWKLVSSTLREADTGEEIQTLGPRPIGFLTYTPGGRVMVVMVAGDRPRATGPTPTDADRAAWCKTALAYAGRYTIQGNTVTHHVEAAVDPSRAAGDLVRVLSLDGDTLTLAAVATGSAAGGRRGALTIIWKKIE